MQRNGILLDYSSCTASALSYFIRFVLRFLTGHGASIYSVLRRPQKSVLSASSSNVERRQRGLLMQLVGSGGPVSHRPSGQGSSAERLQVHFNPRMLKYCLR